MQTDYVDFYLLHCLEENTFSLYTDPELDYLGFLRQMRAEGRIRYLGFSTHASPEMLEQFLAYDDGFDMALMQLNYVDWSLLDAKRQYEILTNHGLPVWVMEPLKGGRLATLNDAACSILKEAAPSRSIPSWGFRYLMGLPNVQTVLSGMGSIEMVEDNAVTFHEHKALDEAELAALEKARAAFMDSLGVPCSGCRYCCAQHLGFSPDTAALFFTVATFVISMTAFVAVFIYERLKRNMDLTILLAFCSAAVCFTMVYLMKNPAVNIVFIRKSDADC